MIKEKNKKAMEKVIKNDIININGEIASDTDEPKIYEKNEKKINQAQ